MLLLNLSIISIFSKNCLVLDQGVYDSGNSIMRNMIVHRQKASSQAIQNCMVVTLYSRILNYQHLEKCFLTFYEI